jgi:hypothetical protein
MKKQVLIAFAVGLCLTVNIWAQVPNYVPTNGLVGWWPFNGNANDGSGNNLNANVIGANLTVDRFGIPNSAYNFDYTTVGFSTQTDEIYIPYSPILNSSAVSISIWVYQRQFVWAGNTNPPMSTLAARFQYGSSGQVWMLNSGTNGINGFSGAPNITLNSWTHILTTFENGTGKIYINGQLISTTNNLAALNVTGNSGISIGESNQANGYWWPTDGIIDDFALWNRALNQQEIIDIFNANSCSNDLTISPTTNTQNIGGNSTFTAATSEANPTYYWQSDFGQGFQNLNDYGNYSGTNTNALNIANVQLANHNQPIRAISTSGNCTDTSNTVTIQIADTCFTNVTVYDTLLTTVTDTLIINTTLSLPAPNNENTILIYPNPASDHITIDNGNFAAMAGYSIKIENNAGQQVFQSAINQAQFDVDLSTWTGNGLYFVHLIDPLNNTVTVRKIVLQ